MGYIQSYVLNNIRQDHYNGSTNLHASAHCQGANWRFLAYRGRLERHGQNFVNVPVLTEHVFIATSEIFQNYNLIESQNIISCNTGTIIFQERNFIPFQ